MFHSALIANKGLWSFTMPSLASGEYLLRGEILALHSAGSLGEAQFYMSCAAIKVTGSGTCSPMDTVSFPGAYSASDPGVKISIYGNTGKPDNGGKAYTIPGPDVAKCGASSGTPASSKPVSSASSSVAISVSHRPTTAGNVVSTTLIVSTRTSTTLQTRTTKISQSTTRVQETNTGRPTAAPVPSSEPEKTGAVPDSTGSGSAPTSVPTGYSMTGPGGKKFVCYEVFD